MQRHRGRARISRATDRHVKVVGTPSSSAWLHGKFLPRRDWRHFGPRQHRQKRNWLKRRSKTTLSRVKVGQRRARKSIAIHIRLPRIFQTGIRGTSQLVRSRQIRALTSSAHCRPALPGSCMLDTVVAARRGGKSVSGNTTQSSSIGREMESFQNQRKRGVLFWRNVGGYAAQYA